MLALPPVYLRDRLRTIVYIDGFNFYYGELRGTPWKWLDPVALFTKVLGPHNDITNIKYFTARVAKARAVGCCRASALPHHLRQPCVPGMCAIGQHGVGGEMVGAGFDAQFGRCLLQAQKREHAPVRAHHLRAVVLAVQQQEWHLVARCPANRTQRRVVVRILQRRDVDALFQAAWGRIWMVQVHDAGRRASATSRYDGATSTMPMRTTCGAMKLT